MSENKIITLPDLGDFEDVEIIEILVGPGDEVEAEQSIIVLESDKATMEIPSPYAGTIESLRVDIGDRILKCVGTAETGIRRIGEGIVAIEVRLDRTHTFSGEISSL